jgi:alkanesulfonate monooxygenase SsuD/methylene tetrahydromethanopterin reductase-like flavin-dependent oxidoreductase (luciferase family)
MQALWADPHVKFADEFHRLDDVGINPQPATGRIPIWFGGHAEATFRRAAKYGDGFMPLAYPPGEAALAALEKLRTLTREAGRDPANWGWKCGSPREPATRTTGARRSLSGKRPESPMSPPTPPI